MPRNPLQKYRTGDRVRIVIRYPGPGRLIEVNRVEGRIVGFVHADEIVRADARRDATGLVVEPEAGRAVVGVPGRDQIEFCGRVEGLAA